MAVLLDDRILDPTTDDAAPDIHPVRARVVVEVDGKVPNHQALTTVAAHRVTHAKKESCVLIQLEKRAITNRVLSHWARGNKPSFLFRETLDNETFDGGSTRVERTPAGIEWRVHGKTA